MYNTLKHLDNLIRHISLVRDNCVVIGKKFIEAGEVEFGKTLIAHGFQHDVSKFFGIEWDYLHSGPDTPKEQMILAVTQHIKTNPHHPEYWGGFHNMPHIYIAEMVADCGARSQEFGTSLKDWISETAISKFGINTESEEYLFFMKCVGMLTEDPFVR